MALCLFFWMKGLYFWIFNGSSGLYLREERFGVGSKGPNFTYWLSTSTASTISTLTGELLGDVHFDVSFNVSGAFYMRIFLRLFFSNSSITVLNFPIKPSSLLVSFTGTRSGENDKKVFRMWLILLMYIPNLCFWPFFNGCSFGGERITTFFSGSCTGSITDSQTGVYVVS